MLCPSSYPPLALRSRIGIRPLLAVQPGARVMKAALSLSLVSLALPGALGASYNLAVDYSGANWFDKWDFYGDTGEWNGTTPWDNTTVGQQLLYSIGYT